MISECGLSWGPSLSDVPQIQTGDLNDFSIVIVFKPAKPNLLGLRSIVISMEYCSHSDITGNLGL